MADRELVVKRPECIELVVKIPEWVYKRAQEMPSVWTDSVWSGIKNGTPLPKGHGKLGDLDALREEVSSWGMNDFEPSDFTDAIDQADTIIEADRQV